MLPRLLLLETSTRTAAVALAHGDTLLSERHLDETRRHARDLAPTIAALLRDQGWRPTDLAAVLVSHGPGSYTGLRVGLMTAKALAYATGCALLAIDTFAAIAAQSPPDCDAVDVLGDAQQQSVYAQSFSRASQGWLPVSELSIVPFADWLARRRPDARVTGPGVTKWLAELPETVALVPEPARCPGVASLLTLGLARYRNGGRDDPFAVEPRYLRPSSAETQWKGR